MGENGRDIPVLKPGVDIATPDKPQPEIDAATRKLYADCLPKTVQIVTDQGKGSGFFMDKDGTIGTAAHVVLGTREQFGVTSDGTRYKLQIEKLDDLNDSAILRPLGLKPGTAPAAEMGSTKDLTPQQPIYPIGYPGGLRPAYISPGNFLKAITQKGLFEQLDANIDKRLDSALKAVTPSELPQVKAVLGRDLLAGSVHIRPGDSGGPMFDAREKVIGISDMITDFKSGYFVPVEKIHDLYNSKESKFDFTYNRIAEPWAQEYKNTWLNKPLVAAGESAALAGAGYVGYRLMSAFPRSFGGTAAALGGLKLLDDAGSLIESTDSRDKYKFALASASDLAGIAGGLAMLSSRYRVGGAIGLAVGIAGRVAADFLPTHLVVTDVQRKDGTIMPPVTMDIQSQLGL
jgi:hypothetical protein